MFREVTPANWIIKPFNECRAGARALLDGLIVLHRGSSVWEFYDHGFAPFMQHIVLSVTKSFTGTLADILAKSILTTPLRSMFPKQKGVPATRLASAIYST